MYAALEYNKQNIVVPIDGFIFLPYRIDHLRTHIQVREFGDEKDAMGHIDPVARVLGPKNSPDWRMLGP